MSRKQVKFNVNPLLSGPSLVERAKAGNPYRELKIADIDVDPNQPRRDFDAEGLAQLAASIKEHGVLCPILVQVGEGGTYRLIAGERRLRASKLLGKETIPAVINGGDETSSVLAKQLVENLQRVDLHALDRAVAIGRLRDETKLSVREIADVLGLSKSMVQRSLEVLALPDDLKAALRNGTSESKVLMLAEVTDPAKRKELLEKLESLSRDELRRQLDAVAVRPSHRGTIREASQEDRRIIEELQRALGTKTQILRQGKDGKGKLLIEFYSTDDLQEIYRRLVS